MVFQRLPKLQSCLLPLLLMLVPSLALAGSLSGPYVVWVNLDGEAGKAVDARIKAVADTSICEGEWLNHPLLYTVQRPPLITNQVVKKAFIARDPVALKQIKTALRRYKDEDVGDDGMDGIYVYTSHGGPRLMSLPTQARRIKSYPVSLDPNDDRIEKAFCAALPPIKRKP